MELLTNFFNVKSEQEYIIWQYHVEYSPSVDSKSVRVGMLLKHEALHKRTHAYDGATLFTTDKLPKDVGIYYFGQKL